MRLLTALAALLASLLLVMPPAMAAADSKRAEFTFTAIPDQDERQLRQRFDKVARYLERQLDLPVRYIPVKSYPAAVTAFRNNQVQLAWFGGLSGVQARNLVPGSHAIAQGFEDPLFKSYFIAHKSAGLCPGEVFPKDIAGKTFLFGSKGSTSGRLMPEFYIRQALRKSPQALFSRVGFSGDHSRTISLVAAGAYQVGAVNYTVWDEAVKNGSMDSNDVQVIWTTPTYPDYQWTLRGDADSQFGAGFSEKLKQTLLDLKAPDLLQSFPRSRFIPADNSVYEPIEQTAKALGLMADY